MGLKDLEGKRTGRPPGARTTSRVRRDIMWAYKNLENPDAKPPSPGAKMWAKHAREQPAHFLACVAMVDAAGQQDGEGDGGADGEPAQTDEPRVMHGHRSQRIKRLFVPWKHLHLCLTGGRLDWIWNIPRDSELVSGAVVPERGGVVLTIHSYEFPYVAEGAPIPEPQSVYLHRS